MEPIALDVHAHLVPFNADRLANITGARWNSEHEVMEIDGHRAGVPALYQPQALISWMERQGVEHAWISIPPPLYRQQLAGDSASQWLGYLNDGLQKICERFPKQLSALFHLPVEHPALAAQEAARRIAAGARAFSMAAGGQGTPVYSDSALEPLWTTLDAAGCFLLLHPGACCDGRLKAFYLENLVGNPYETAVAAAHLIFGGVCERFTKLRFCLAHGGGATAMLASRMQHGFATGRQGIDTRREAPRAALARFHADSVVHDNTALAFVAGTFGEDRILFGSDWPFPMGVMEPHRQIASLPDPLRKKVFWDNPYNLRQQYAWRPEEQR